MVKRLLTVVLLILVATTMPVPSARAADGPALRLDGSIGGRALSSIDTNDPLRLMPDGTLLLRLEVTNPGDKPVTVPRVRFYGRVLGLTFFNFTVQVGLTVLPGETATSTFELALDGLGTQATGLLQAEISLIGTDGSALLDRNLPVDVRGEARSVYGVFALAVTVLTLVMLAGLLFRLGARRLPTSRWSRAWRFALPGGGIGLSLTVGLSVVRAAVPTSDRSISLLLGGFLVGFVVGYLSPSQDDDGDPEAVYDDDVITGEPQVLDLRQQILDLDSHQVRSDT